MGPEKSFVELNLAEMGDADATKFPFPSAGDDVTFYVSNKKGRSAFVNRSSDLPGPLRFSGEGEIKANGGTFWGRLLACECWFGKYPEKPWISCTIRVKRVEPTASAVRSSKGGKASGKSQKTASNSKLGSASPDPLGAWSLKNDPAPLGIAIGISDLARTLIDRVLSGASFGGLVVLAGATSSGKTKVAQAIMAQLLAEQKVGKPGRLQHVITLEDPVEDFLFADPFQAQENGINYTARRRVQTSEEDHSLAEAVDDALRQTPAIFYVSEIRNDQDWKELLRMAGTGHLVVTTTHANSVTECMRRILSAMHVESARGRGEVAQRLNSVIQLGPVEIDLGLGQEKGRVKTTVSAAWRNTPQGVSALVSDGLDSLLPNRGKTSESRGVSLGRRHLVDVLPKVALLKTAFEKVKKDVQPAEREQLSKQFWEALEVRSLELDEAGL
jgi:Tfp pilus assembly pilus retraction ATPase PilT